MFLVVQFIIISISLVSHLSGGFLNKFAMVKEMQELPAAESNNALHLIPFISTTTTGEMTLFSSNEVKVGTLFIFLLQIDVWWR